MSVSTLGARRDTDLFRLGIAECRAITRRYGTSFYFATQFFPRETRQGIYAIYAFARIPDEIVDNPGHSSRSDRIARLKDWRVEWLEAMEAGRSCDPVMFAIVRVFKKYDIPIADGEAFLASMFMDEEKKSYATYSELEEYMYGSAGVIGLMVTRVVGFSTEDAFPHAIKLGYAFQLTNFLRDIREDAEELGRVYMPEDELSTFGLETTDLRRSVYDKRFVDFMKFQIERNKQVYKEAFPGIKMLNWRGQLAVKISYVLYKAILGEIERADYNVYRQRVRTDLRKKLRLSLWALAGVYE